MDKLQLFEKMLNDINYGEKPIEINTILEYVTEDIILQYLISDYINKLAEIKEQKICVDNCKKTTTKKQYNTKKEIQQEITSINKKIDEYMQKKYDAPNEATEIFYELMIEDYVSDKQKLKKKLELFGKKFNNKGDLERAKQRPITDYIDFKGGFARCIFHTEKTASMKLYNNHIYCFSCQRKGDVIDVVMELQGVDLPTAIRIILCQ